MGLVVVDAFLTQARVGVVVGEGGDIKAVVVLVDVVFVFNGIVARLHLNEGGISFAQCQGIAVYHDFHGVAEGSKFHQLDDGIGDETHVKEMLATLSFAVHSLYGGGLPYI